MKSAVIHSVASELADIAADLKRISAGRHCTCDGECVLRGLLVRLAVDADHLAGVCRDDLEDAVQAEIDAMYAVEQARDEEAALYADESELPW